MGDINVDLNGIIIKAFKKILWAIINCKYNRIILKGGRNSTKSSVVAVSIILGVLLHKCSAVCMVKYDNKVYDRLVSTFNEMINRLGLSEKFRYKVQSKEFVILDKNGKETNNGIKFTGVDDPAKLKSFKPRSGKGGFRYIWFEEAYDFYSKEEITNIIDTMGRGEGEHCIIITYNPPKSRTNWLNKEYNSPSGNIIKSGNNWWVNEVTITYNDIKGNKVDKIHKQLVHHSTYLDVLADGHAEWLGETLVNAELAKVNNETEYRWMYMGEAIGEEGSVFTNIKELKPDIEFSKEYINRGMDFGFTTDPVAIVSWAYDRKKRIIYSVGECCKKGLSNESVAYEIGLLNPHNFKVWADSAEPRTINELNSVYGKKVVGVTKGADSVRFGVKWLQGLNAIYIDPIACPNTYREFTEYEYKKDRHGEFTGELSEKNNHMIDATRYALCTEIN